MSTDLTPAQRARQARVKWNIISRREIRAAMRGDADFIPGEIDNLHAVEQKHRETANAEFHRANRLQVEIERLTKERDYKQTIIEKLSAHVEKAEAERDEALAAEAEYRRKNHTLAIMTGAAKGASDGGL